MFSSGVRVPFLITNTTASFVFNYYHYHEFFFPGGVHGYCLMTATIMNSFFRVACTIIFQLVQLLRVLCFSGGVHDCLQLLLLLRILFFFGWRARLLFYLLLLLRILLIPGGVHGYYL